MAKRSPDTPRPSPEVTQTLDDIFALCRVPFVYDFIFTADPVADISILTAPVQNEHAIAARITVSGTEKTASFAHIFDFTSDYYFCSIPAFSIGSITVGFATLEPTSESKRAGLNAIPMERVKCNRYVRDDDKGVHIMFAENSVTGLTEVDCIHHRSTRRRTRVCAWFQTQTLRARLRGARGAIQPEALADALSYLSVATELRVCPICKAEGDGECKCVLPFRRPLHPLDFRNERWNMRFHTGLYEGGSTLRLFSSSLPFVITALSTKTVISGTADQLVVSRLNKFAVQDRLALLKVSPFGSVECGGDGEWEERKEEVASKGQLAESFMQESLGFGRSSFGSFGSFGSLSLADALIAGPTPGVGTPVGNGEGLMDTMSYFAESDPSVRTMFSSEEDANGTETGTRGDEENAAKMEVGIGEDENEKKLSRTASKETGVAVNGVSAGMVDKAERRRQRNREAAAKSNVKRKIRNDTLRRSLKEVCERAEYLRGVEKKLREENVRLRGLATKRMIRVSEHLTHIQIGNSRRIDDGAHPG